MAPLAGPEPVVEASPPPQSEATKQGRGTKRARIWAEVEKELFPDATNKRGKKEALFAFNPKVQVCRATDAFDKAELPKGYIKQDLRCWGIKERPTWILGKDYGKAVPVLIGGPDVFCVTRRVAQYLYAKKH